MKRCPLCARSYPNSERFCSEHALPLIPEPSLDGFPEGDLTGHVLDRRYQLGGVLGSGGMGTVYDAQDLRIGRHCAVKVLLPDLGGDIQMRRRLFREIQATSQIRHPNVIEILDYGEDELAGAYLVTEYLTGRSLDAIITSYSSLSLSFSLQVALQICDALEAIHSHGLLHCDIKPSNIYLLPSGRVKLLDFGLVKPYGTESADMFRKITTGAMAFGTPQYMSPEQSGFDPLDPRCDLYSMGVVLYEMLLHQPPFEGDSAFDVIEAHRRSPVPLPKQVNPTIILPAQVEMLLLKLLSKGRQDRPTSAAEVAESIRVAADSLRLDLGSVKLGPVASGAPPSPEPTKAVELTLPIPAPIEDFDRLVKLAAEHRDSLLEQVVVRLCEAIPRYRNLDPQKMRESLKTWHTAFLNQLGENPPETLPEEIEALISTRGKERFSATEMLGAFWLGYWACRPLLRQVTGPDLERYAALEDRFEARLLPFYMRLAERYVVQFNQSLSRKNELLAQQNEELLVLRNQLDERLRHTHRELAEAERVKARVADSITSGLVLVDLGTQEIVLFNRAAERLSGLRALDVVSRPVDQIFHLVEGVPFEEFIEQVRDHGQVGLRKLKVRFPNGNERTIYLRGQPYQDADGRQTGVLFVIEDVTEREKIIESFSRYVSREVSQQILRSGRPMRSAGEPRRAVLLAVGIHGFRTLLDQLPPERAVELLDQYVRAVGNAVFHHGGVIDAMVGNSTLVYFANNKQRCREPVRSALELCQRMERLNTRREQHGQPRIEVSVGLHVGQVLLINVGGKRRMVHTVLGEPADVARALQEEAQAGEILITEAVARDLEEEGVLIEPGQVVPVKGYAEPVKTLRLPMIAPEQGEEEVEEDLEPPTLS